MVKVLLASILAFGMSAFATEAHKGADAHEGTTMEMESEADHSADTHADKKAEKKAAMAKKAKKTAKKEHKKEDAHSH